MPGQSAEQDVIRHDVTLLMVLLAGAAFPGTVMADPLEPETVKLDSERLAPGLYPAPPTPAVAAPDEPHHSPIELDWSVGLKGAYTASSEGGSFLTTLNPRFTATHQGVRTDLVLDGGAVLARGSDGQLAATSLDLTLGATTQLDRDTTLTGGASLKLSRDLPGTPGLNPLVTVPPLTASGGISGALDRRLGRFNIGVQGSLERTLYGPSTRTDTGMTDNANQNLWEGDTSLRLGLQATPIFEIFGEGSLGRDWFDHAGTGGTRADATSRALRTGITGRWNGILTASASVGVGQHDFDDASLNDITTRLYDASITYTPDPTLNLTAGLSTSIEPTGVDASGSARVAHRATANVDYTVNSWLRLRASADWSQSWVDGGSENERRHGVGTGADYKVNARTAVSADYAYAHRDNSTTGRFESHTVSLGVTLRR